MAKKKAGGGKGNALGNVTDYRHEGATRVSIPPAKIAAEGAIPKVSDVRYDYSPRRPPTLRFDPQGAPDKIFDRLDEARPEEASPGRGAARRTSPGWSGRASGRRRRSRWTRWRCTSTSAISTQAILRASRRGRTCSAICSPIRSWNTTQAVQFYQHDVDWSNRLILGDCLQVMASPGAARGPGGQGADDLHGPALRDQVRLQLPAARSASAT